MAMHRPGTPSPENCPEPWWHETHRYCPVCTWIEPQEKPTREQLVAVLAGQVEALVVLARAGGDIRKANLDDRLLIDRLQDTLDALKKG